MHVAFEVPEKREETLCKLKAEILRLGLKTAADGVAIVSPKGKPQSWLVDMRRVFMRRLALEQIARVFWAEFGHHERFQIAGMETAAIPLLIALAIHAPKSHEDVNVLIVRKERKSTGLCNAVEGDVTQVPTVLIDDVINSGSSAEKARVVIEKLGLSVSRMFVVIDYQSCRGLTWRKDKAIEVSSLFNLTDLELELTRDPPPPTQRYRERWRTEVPGGFAFNVVPKSGPVLWRDRVFRGCDSGKMHAFDADSGEIVWEYAVKATGRKGIMSVPLVYEGHVYFGAFNGVIYCLDAVSGREVWSQSHGDWVGASPVVSKKHHLVYFGIEYARPWAKGGLAALDVTSGSKVWEHLVRGLQHGSAAYWEGGDLVIWGTADHEMAALDAKTGEIAWTFPTRRSVKYAPSIDEDRGIVAFASFDKSIYVLDLRTGALLGEWETGEICYTTPLIHENQLFCGSGDKKLYVIDLDRMELRKAVEVGARVYSSPRLVNGRVIFGTCGGLVLELDPDSLEVNGRLQLPDAITNAVASSEDGTRLYVSTYMNHLYSFDRESVRARDPGRAILPAAAEVPSLGIGVPEHLDESHSSVNFERVAVNCDISGIRREVLSQSDMWKLNTKRQDTVAVQRETESIFLRSAKRTEGCVAAVEDIHDSDRTPSAVRFPKTMEWLERFAETRNGALSRVLLAKLRPGGRVYRHFDRGDYYRVRDRYHLVILSPSGSYMVCGGEEVMMHEAELWWFDNKKHHESFNESSHDRVHLIFDLLPRGTPQSS